MRLYVFYCHIFIYLENFIKDFYAQNNLFIIVSISQCFTYQIVACLFLIDRFTVLTTIRGFFALGKIVLRILNSTVSTHFIDLAYKLNASKIIETNY